MSELPLTPVPGNNPGLGQAAASYQPPVARLLTLGQPALDSALDYGALGLGSAEIPELIRMIADKALHQAIGDTPFVWAPVHAWRALAELQAEAAIPALIGLLPDVDTGDDWIIQDLPKVFGAIGPAAFASLSAYLTDAAHEEWSRGVAATALGEIGQRHPAHRPESIHRLTAYLEQPESLDATINAHVVCALLDLKAEEALPAMERAFAEERVDESFIGDWEDVQIEFGLKTERDQPHKWTNLFGPLSDDLSPLFPGEVTNEMPVSPALNLPYVAPPKIGRNDPCPCGSGKKYKKCCGA